MSLRDDAIAIWKAAVAAVDSERLVGHSIVCEDGSICIGEDRVDLATTGRIEVVGAGKAGAGMARGVLAALSGLPANVDLGGWVNVPEDCVESLDRIHLHAARPAGINEPTQAGVDGTLQIINRIQTLGENDLCIVLISGGGSALLPAPVPEVSLESKQLVTRFLASAGAPISDLNVVRSQISLVKGGGLLRHCGAGKLIALVISDVIGDPLDIIASGPTVPRTSCPADALAVLARYDSEQKLVPDSVYAYLESQLTLREQDPPLCDFSNYVIGSNQVAISAAEVEALNRGYSVINLGSQNCGSARGLGEALINRLQQLRKQSDVRSPKCILAGGETTVELAETLTPRRGGRNQEVVLAAIAANSSASEWRDLILLSGGTDGEDGPTDAAGAWADEQLVKDIVARSLSAHEHLAINNSYPFFDAVGGLLMTGPTHTNVMDVAVGLLGR